MNASVKTITRNLLRFYECIAERCGYESGYISGIYHCWNRQGTWPCHLLGQPLKKEIPALVEAIREIRVPPFWILEDAEGEEAALLEEHGLRMVKLWSGMILDPDDFKPVPANPSVKIITGDPGTLDHWLEIVNTEVITGAQMGKEVTEAVAGHDSFQWFVAYTQDDPVGSGLVFSDDGVSGMYMIGTRRSARGKGIGSAMLSSMIEMAIESGNHTMILQGTGMGESIYLRTGFRTVNRYAIMWHLGT